MSKSAKNILLILGSLIILEGLSFFGFINPLINQIVFGLLVLATIIVSARNLENGLLLVLLELIVGSKGYLFYFPYGEGKMLALRLAIWSAFMLVFAIKFGFQLARAGQKSAYWLNLKKFIFWRPFKILAFFVFIGLISGLVYRNGFSNIFLDFNAWLYFLILLPAAALDLKIEKLKTIFLAGGILISLKTLILLGIFSNNFAFAPTVYAWLRKTLVGEMTTASGWNRVFIQSQIFPIIAYYFLFFKAAAYRRFRDIGARPNLGALILAALFFSTLLISLSRSFWFGFALTIALALAAVWRLYSGKQAVIVLSWLLGAALLGLFMIVAVTPRLIGNLDDQVAGRLGNKQEAAAVSRWSLLPKLFGEIKRNPLTGQGYGATVTYISSDPRVRENNPGGEYTTYAFEWGYLDIWLKIGFFGLIFYIGLLFQLIRKAYLNARKKEPNLYLGLAAGLVFLAAVNVFTPYLNHPLGIGFIVISSCLISKDRVY